VNIYQQITYCNAASINPDIERGFLRHHNDADVLRTHLFGGRYENIYLNDRHIPVMKTLVTDAVQLAQDILGIDNLRAGYWFNYMPPGATTTLHTHDDDDELLSCVYYVNVPENSGNLILYNDATAAGEKIEIQSRSGDFIFFRPDVRHEVSENRSSEHRLSIGFNFGRDK
jgi:hypothetical protein